MKVINIPTHSKKYRIAHNFPRPNDRVKRISDNMFGTVTDTRFVPINPGIFIDWDDGTKQHAGIKPFIFREIVIC